MRGLAASIKRFLDTARAWQLSMRMHLQCKDMPVPQSLLCILRARYFARAMREAL